MKDVELLIKKLNNLSIAFTESSLSSRSKAKKSPDTPIEFIESSGYMGESLTYMKCSLEILKCISAFHIENIKGDPQPKSGQIWKFAVFLDLEIKESFILKEVDNTGEFQLLNSVNGELHSYATSRSIVENFEYVSG